MTASNEQRSLHSESANLAEDTPLPRTSTEPTKQTREDQSPSVAANIANEPVTTTPNDAATENAYGASADKNGEGPRAPPTSQNADAAKVLNMGLPEKSNKDLESRLSNFLGDYKSVKMTGSRSYDYEEKYEDDRMYEETGPDARVFKVYNDEAEKYDNDMVRGFRDTLDALLVFAALFSAVVTTFVVQTAQALHTDQAQVTNYLLIEQILLLRANGNATAINTVFSSNLGPDSKTYNISDIWINGLFFISLSLSLAAALLSVLAKQWLQAYTAATSGTARDVALIRQLRFSELVKWRLHEIVGALPLILHASLAVFSAGLVVFLRNLYPALSWIVVSISGLSFAIYLGSMVIPAIDVSCPYRIPLLYAPSRYIVSVFHPLYRITVCAICASIVHALAIASAVQAYFQSYLPPAWGPQNFLYQIKVLIQSTIGYICTLWYRRSDDTTRAVIESAQDILEMSAYGWTLTDSEVSQIREYRLETHLPLACEAILWLHDMSSNVSVRRIATWSTASSLFGFSKYPQSAHLKLKMIYLKSIGEMFEHYFARADNDPNETVYHAMCNLRSISHELHISCRPSQVDLVQQLIRAATENRYYHVTVLIQRWQASVNVTDSEGRFPLACASMNGHLPTVDILLNYGADVNLRGGTYVSALGAASNHGHLHIAKALLERGADVNFTGGIFGSALAAASHAGHLEIIKLLLDWGAIININSWRGYYGQGPALALASSGGYINIVKLLLDKGADVNLAGGTYGSALQVASYHGRLEIVQLLLSRGAAVNCVGGEYGSPLHATVKAQSWNIDLEIVKLLLESGSDVNLKDNAGRTVLQVAESESASDPSDGNRTEVVNILKAHIASNELLPADGVA